MSLLERQLKAHREKHGLLEVTHETGRRYRPSILFTREESRAQDAESIAALARKGLADLASTEPDLAACSSLFEGRQPDREGMTKQQNEELDKEIRHLLQLLSPHLMLNGAPQVLEGLIYHYDASRWNVDALMACALPYHDSPLFTRLLKCLAIEGKPLWQWLQPWKEKSATLVRMAVAKYCTKDLSLLHFIGRVVQDMVKLHKANRALSTFFAAVWLDALSITRSITSDMVEAALPPVLAALRRPHLQDSFQTALIIVSALCLKTDLEDSAHSQLLERAAKQLGSEQGKPAVGLVALLLQLQQVESLPERAIHSMATAGPEALAHALPSGVDCGNLLGSLVEGCLYHASMRKEGDVESETLLSLVQGLLSDEGLLRTYASPIAMAAMQGYCHAVQQGATKQRASDVSKVALTVLSSRQPVALGLSLRKSLDAALKNGLPANLLVELVESVPGGTVDASGSGSLQIMPVMDALTKGTPKVRAVAMEKATADLAASSGQEEDLPRQRILASMLLSTAEDADLEVAKAALNTQALWSTLPQVDPVAAARVLDNLLSLRLKNLSGMGGNLSELFRHAVQESRTAELLPLVLRCFAWLYGRKDCPAPLCQWIDATLLPLVILGLMGLDTVPNKEQAGTKPLRSALLEFCGASSHKLLEKLSGQGAMGAASASATPVGTGPLCQAAVQAADTTCALGLCQLAEGKPWPLSGEVPLGLPAHAGLVGGAAAQVAAAALLAQALPRVLGSLGTAAGAEELALRAADACQTFAGHQAGMKDGEGACPDVLQLLFGASLQGFCSLEASRCKGSSGEGKRRKKSGASGGALISAQSPTFKASAQHLLRLALQRPKALSAQLQDGLSGHLSLLSPALIAVALGPEASVARRKGKPALAQASAATANALLLLRSLLLSEAAVDLSPDQSLLVPLVSRLGSSEAPEVRAAAFEVLKSLEGCSTTNGCWDTPCAAMLREAGVLRPPAEVLPVPVWGCADAEEQELSGLAEKSFEAIMQQLMAHKPDILQGTPGAALALSKALTGKGSASRAARGKACGFWAVGLSMLGQDLETATVTSALPPHLVLSSLSAPLKAAVAELATTLKSSGVQEAPLALRTAAACFKGLSKRSQQQAVKAVEEEAARSFVSDVALPLCSAVGKLLKAGGTVSESLAELLALLCQGLAAAALLSDELRLEVMGTLFALGVTAAVPAGKKVEAAEEADAVAKAGPVAQVVSAVETALTEMPHSAAMVHKMITESLQFKNLGAPAAELLCKQIAGLKPEEADMESGGALLSAVAERVKAAGSQLAAAEGADEELTSVVEQLLLAVAALSEILARAPEKDEAMPVILTACKTMNSICKGVGQHLSPGMLMAIVRACGALATLLPPVQDSAEVPAPLKCCVAALTGRGQSLRVDVLSSLKQHLPNLWRFPELADNVKKSSSILLWDQQAQRRLRLMLHSLLLEQTTLVERADASVCLSFSESAGRCASLDFAALLYLARQGPVTSKRKMKKRRATKQEALAEEFLAEVLPPQAEEIPAEEALQMLLSPAPEARYQCVATLSQSLSALALHLSTPDRGSLAWGPSLLPPSFVQSVDAERAFWVLKVGLEVISRFVGEQGLPSGLDEAEVSTQALRATALLGEEEVQADVVALGICYLVWSTCTTQVLLGSSDDTQAQGCRDQAKELQALVLRSLAVNHPVTFFRSVCLTMQVPAHCPSPSKEDLFAKQDFVASQAECIMVAAHAALKDRGTLQSETAGEDGAEEDEETRKDCAELCMAAIRHSCERYLSGASNAWQRGPALVVWRFLEAVCRFGGASVAAAVNELCLPAVAGCLSDSARSMGPDLQVAVESCGFLETAVVELNSSLLEGLNIFVNPLLKCTDEIKSDVPSRPLEERALGTATTLVKTLGKFLSPFLGRMLSVVSAQAEPWKTKLLESLGWELTASVPNRLLLPAIQKDVASLSFSPKDAGDLDAATALIEAGIVRAQRLSSLLTWAFTDAPPEDVAADADANTAALLRLLGSGGSAAAAFLAAGGDVVDLPAKVYKQNLKATGAKVQSLDWVNGCSVPSSHRLNELVSKAVGQFALRLDLDDLKPRFVRILEWARNSQAHLLQKQSERKGDTELAEDTEDASRALAICAVMQSLVAEAPDIAEEMLLPLVCKDLASQLRASRACALQLAAELRPAAKKRRRSGIVSGSRPFADALVGHSWWWFEVASASLSFVTAALRPAGTAAQRAKAVEDVIEGTVEPCCDLLDIFEFLPSSEENEHAAALLRATQSGLVALAAASDSAHMKQVLTAILAKSRGDDAEVRLNSVRCCHKIWSELGIQAASGLSEVVMYASELLEDEDPKVESTVRAMIKTMEDCTGENLQDSLKH